MTKVAFRKFDEGDLIVLFPYNQWDTNGNITSYQSIGQHGSASAELIDELDTPTWEEVLQMKSELISIGYEDLEVVGSYVDSNGNMRSQSD